MLLLRDDAVDERRRAAREPDALGTLARGLAAELEPLVGTEEIWVPPEKARLTRIGGRCPHDGTVLAFDPWERERHRCERCGDVQSRAEDYRLWIHWYQLWLAERAVHAALLHLLLGERRHAEVARRILARYAEVYLDYPNRDNVLGPTRPFFSTYLESIWLLQLCIALDLLEAGNATGGRELGERVRDRVVEPSAALIASYDEGASNRQVWNNAARLAAARLLGRDDTIEPLVYGSSGLAAHLAHGLLPDGTWYEGENYHLFAHRGLWYGMIIAERAGVSPPPALIRRFDEGFATPFLVALPDLTLPSRRDSQYRISLRQPRFAEMCELGLARGDDRRLLGALHALYGGDLPRADTGRMRSTADVERNGPPTALSRDDLGWRALLHARPVLPPLPEWSPSSVLLAGQGLGVIRREGGRVYLALDYGHPGGGHGHPDRLNVTLAAGEARWLDDPGTGSYVDRTLHWYRSTLAHNAPLVNGASQRPVHGTLRAWDERGGVGWIDAAASGIAAGVEVRRCLVAFPDHVIDCLEWGAGESPGAFTLDLPLHVDGAVQGIGQWESATLTGGAGLEDGFAFVTDASCARVERDGVAWLESQRDDGLLRAWMLLPSEAELWRATAPGPPGEAPRRFHLVRVRERSGRIAIVWDWRGAIAEVSGDGSRLVVTMTDGTRHEHERSGAGWAIAMTAGRARTSVLLSGAPPREEAPPPALAPSSAPRRAPFVIPRASGTGEWLAVAADGAIADALVLDLGESHYRRSESSWRESGAPTARVFIRAVDDRLVVEAAVRKEGALMFADPARENPLDNEPAGTNGDGAQLYLRAPDVRRSGGWLLVPVPSAEAAGRALGAVHLAPVPGWGNDLPLSARWSPRTGGWALRCEVPLAAIGHSPDGALRFEMDLIINEMGPGRERRRGQLVLSGVGPRWIYLQGDRQAPSALLPFVVPGD